MVLAPAGSGKTRVLISRIGHLIKEKQVSPYEILDFTFTRKASGELKERLEKEIGGQAHKILTGTIHGVALKLLQKYGEFVGLRPDKITVYGSWEEQFLLKEVAKELGYHTGHAWKKIKKGDVDAAFNLYYTTGYITTKEVSVNINVIMNAFFARCRENNALTYGTILTTFLRLIPEIAQYLNLRHIMVDEVQDLDPLQWEIINLLCKYTGASLFAIGDPNQSIFAFRGADPEYLIRNQSLFDVYNLTDNYRSSSTIVDAANNLISHNALNMGEPMNAIREDYYNVVTLKNQDSAALVSSIEFFGYDKIAVLARNHWPLEKLSTLLTQSGIKHEYLGKQSSMVRGEEFRRFHAFLKLIVNPFDNFSFLLIRDYLGVDDVDYRDIRLHAVVRSKSHFQVWQEIYSKDSPYAAVFLDHMFLSELVFIIKYAATGAAPFKEPGFNPNCEEICKFMFSWCLDNPAGTISQYLGWLATFDVQDEIKAESDCLQLLTIHSAKGLEFSTVIIAGLNEGIFPGDRSIKNNELEQERNLAYVAWTRAENQLILTSRPAKKDKLGLVTKGQSRFIKESL